MRWTESLREISELCAVVVGSPTKSYRSREPLRIVGEIEQWEGHPPERLKEMKDHLARMEAEGGAEIID